MANLGTWIILTVALSWIQLSAGAPLKEDTESESVDKVKESSRAKDNGKDPPMGKNNENTIFGMDNAISYLSKYGYLGSSGETGSDQTQTVVDTTFALKEFQHMFGIEETGALDEATKKQMKLPRCGVADMGVDSLDKKRREKRFSYEGSRWRNSEVSYYIARYTSDVPRSVLEEQIKRAFDTWETHISLTFKQVQSWEQPDITIIFADYDHGDGIPFDGPGGTLAHAFFPRYGGDAHFDDSETFTANRYGGVDLHMVVAHEIGHSLGLGHSRLPSALMAPAYRGYNPSFQLSQDDIKGMQFLYGARTNGATTSTTPRPSILPSTSRTSPRQASPSTTPPIDSTPNFCEDVQVDAMVNYDGKTYAFRGSYYAELDRSGVVDGFPRLISSGWEGLPDNVDASLRWEAVYGYVRRNGVYVPVLTASARTYFFKGGLYWRYDDGVGLRSGYPRFIASGFPGVPNDLDAAFVWSNNGWTFFIKGSNYYRYTHGFGVRIGYPRPLSDWRGLPSSINAAFQWSTNRRNYFFSGQNYYRTNYRTMNTDYDYPRPTTFWWFGCPGDMGMFSNMEIGGSDDHQEMIGEWPPEKNDTSGATVGPSDVRWWDDTSGSDLQQATGGQGTLGMFSGAALLSFATILFLII